MSPSQTQFEGIHLPFKHWKPSQGVEYGVEYVVVPGVEDFGEVFDEVGDIVDVV